MGSVATSTVSTAGASASSSVTTSTSSASTESTLRTTTSTENTLSTTASTSTAVPTVTSTAATTIIDEKYIFEITDVRLLIKTIDLMDGLSLDIARKLDTEPARYGIRKTFLKSLFISQGRTDFVANIFTEEWVNF